MIQKSIMLVDDEDIILNTVGKDLEEAGYQVTTVDNGEEAITLLERGHFDLVLTDLVMEGVDGIQVLKETKKILPETCVILLTGFGDLHSAIEALRLGADDYLLKPTDLDELLIRIKNSLDKQEMKKRISIYEDILPICSLCKKIRDDTGKEHGTGEWLTVEEYLHRKTGMTPSHSYCPHCINKVAW